MPPDDRSRPTPQQGDSQNLIQDQGTTDGDTSARGQVTPTDPTLAPSLDLLAQFAEPATCLDQALAYAAQGVPVFPLKAGAKTPATPHGFKDATTDPEQIRAWWAKWPDANIGMPTGQASGRIVLDPDNGPAGLQALAQLQAEIGALPPTLTVRTPGDKAQGKEPGLHLHLAHPGGKVKNSAGKLGDALDVRGDGGYVVLPPSTLTDGPYTVETDAPVAELPDAWAGLLRNGTRETPKPAQDRGRGRFVLASKPARSFTHAEALDYLTEQALIPLRKAQDGTINEQLNASAMIYGHFVGGGLGTEEQAEAELLEALEHTAYDGATWQAGPTIESGLRAGMAEPYEVTDLEQDQEQEQAEDKEKSGFEQEVDNQLAWILVREEAQRRHRAGLAGQLPDPDLTSLADLLAEPDDDPAWRIEGLWPTGGNVILAAQRKAGKTTLGGNLIRCLADGDDFLGRGGKFTLVGQGGYTVTPIDGMVALLDLELDRRMLRRWLRDQAIAKTDRVLAESLRGRALLFDVLDEDRRQRWADFLAKHEVKVLILDPLGALLDAYGRDENSNSDVGPVLQGLDALKDGAGIEELILVHHFGHGPERSRGASKLRGWPDVEWFLYREKAANGEEPPPDAARFFAAEGRDVAVTEARLDYDPATRRLWIAGGNRVQHQANKHGPALLQIIEQTPGLSQTQIVDQAQGAGIARDPARNAIRALITAGKVRTEPGERRAVRHYPADTGQEQGR